MKNIIISAFAALLISFSTGCVKKCRPDCNPSGGICIEGKCDCLFWMEGPDCGTEVRKQYIGTYTGTMRIGTQTQQFTANITAQNAHPRVLEMGQYTLQFLDGNMINYTISSKIISGQIHSGSGSFSGKKMNAIIKVQDGTDVYWVYINTSRP